MIERLKELDAIVQNLHGIPANEQCIGHLQVAVQRALILITDELAFLHGFVEPVR